jgi:HSP20 family molecular chaperone IbpA
VSCPERHDHSKQELENGGLSHDFKSSNVELARSSGRVRLVPIQILMECEREIRKLIERRAYELFEHRGRRYGSELSDWLSAESEILFSCRHDLKDLADRLVLKAEMPGSFSASQLRLSVEPRLLMVCGERAVERIVGDPNGTYIRTEPQRIFRKHELPEEVDPSRVVATLRGNVLEVVMPRVKKKESVRTFELIMKCAGCSGPNHLQTKKSHSCLQ